MKNYILIIPLLFFLCVQNYAQWEKTNFTTAFKVTSLAIKDSMIFASTDGDGIFVSTDNGANWKSINEGLECKVVQTIFINENPPPDGQTAIFAGTGTGASVSKNNGLTWSTIKNGLSGDGVWSFTAGEVTPNYTTLFAGTWSGNVYKSTDNGTSWVETSFSTTLAKINKAETKFPNSSLVTVCHMTAMGKYVYASTIGDRLLVSSNNGEDWMDNSFNIYEPKYDRGGNFIGWGPLIGLKPVYALGKINSTVVVSAGYGYIGYKPLNSMSFITPKSGTVSGYQILCFAGHDGKIFAGDSMGEIFLSEDEGVNWNWFYPSDLSVYTNAVYSLALNNSYIFAGTKNGIWRFRYPENVTAVDKFNKTPTGFSLEQNYPNPFNSSTKIKFTIPRSSNVSLKVYNVLGKLVSDLVNKYMPAGTYEVEFSQTDLPSGIYFYSFAADEYRSTKKIILLK